MPLRQKGYPRSPVRTQRTAGAVVALSVASIVVTAAAPAAQGSDALTPVRDLVVTATGDTATVTWQPPASGTVARYQVEAHRSDYFDEVNPDFGTRIVSGSTLSITWDGLPLNHPMYFTVVPVGPDGPHDASGAVGPFNSTASVTPSNSYCPATQLGDCVVVDPANVLGAESRPAAGLLLGNVPIGNKWVGALHLNFWRISANSTTEYREAAAVVPPQNVIEVLSDSWDVVTNNGGYAADPWASWSTYTNFISTTVQQAEQAGENPIWEIQNEPENYPYNPAQPPTRALVEEEYLKAYQAIKQVDPNARVIGPSIDWQYEDADSPWYIDLKTFIPFAAANGMKLYAIAWHDNWDAKDLNPLVYQEMPQAVRDYAEEVRELIAENPGIGSPKLFVDENSSAAGSYIPGFAAGYFAAAEEAGLDEANRSCWPYPGSSSFTTCAGPNLGGLLNSDGNPNASYWTMVDYGAMSGVRVGTESSDINLSPLAVTDPSGVTRVLLGRHQTCSEPTTTSSDCNGPSTLPAPVPTIVRVLQPAAASAATVQMQAIPDSRADLTTAPPAITSTVPVVGGLASISIPSFGDGQAYFLTIKPNVTTGTPAASGDASVAESPSATGDSVATRTLPISGGNQSAVIFHRFGQPLVVLATDQYGNPMANTPVTFALSAAFAHFGFLLATTATVTTDANGIATSPPFTAGWRSGRWVATATVTGSGLSHPVAYFGMVNMP